MPKYRILIPQNNKKKGFLRKMAAKVSAKTLLKPKNKPPGMTVLSLGHIQGGLDVRLLWKSISDISCGR
jgi:hypothetical protein